MSQQYAHVTGWGMAVPERVMTNEEIAKMVDTSDEWIVSRTGIRERRIASETDTTGSLATEAALLALEKTEIDAHELDLIIVATASPEHYFPSTASIVQDQIGATYAGAFDLSAACTGFIYAVNMGAQAIRSGSIKNVLVIGSETLSRMINWNDRNTCILFGDGAGAFVLEGRPDPGGIITATMRSDGSGANLLEIPAGGSKNPASLETIHENLHTIRMNGREVFRFATRVMASATREVTAQAGLELEDIDLVVPHQANRRIIDAASRGLHMPPDKFVVNVDRYGNTSAASIPIAVCEALEDGRIHPGDKLVLVGFGGGLTWGAIMMEWSEKHRAVPEAKKRRTRVLVQLARVRSASLRLWRSFEGVVWGS